MNIHGVQTLTESSKLPAGELLGHRVGHLVEGTVLRVHRGAGAVGSDSINKKFRASNRAVTSGEICD